ncbi:MAG TPA: LysR family transcriptional regulator [Candidatus Binatia bacterium]|nr:LysR family transcriptional regulator [Candidatus Binatia bacterium]
METLANLESFVRSAELGGFSAAARRLGLTPAAVSRNVARLEGNLGLRLFQRSTRHLALTEAGERFLADVRGGLESIQGAIAVAGGAAAEPAGVLKVSMALAFGLDYILPLLPAFRAAHPKVAPDLHFDNRQVDLIGEGFDAAIGGGVELTEGIVARELARVHFIAVAAPDYLKARGLFGRKLPRLPDELAALDGIAMRSALTGRLAARPMRNAEGEEVTMAPRPDIVVNDAEAMARCAAMGLGVALLPLPSVVTHLHAGRLVRLLPEWHADIGPIAIYYSSGRLLPAKTRAFVDFVLAAFKRQRLAERFSAV